MDRRAVSALLMRAEHEQALRLAIIVIDGAGCEPGRCTTLGSDVALSRTTAPTAPGPLCSTRWCRQLNSEVR